MNGKYKTIKSYRKDIIPEGAEEPVNPPQEYILNETEYDNNNNEIKEITYHADGTVEQISEYKYDGAGNLTEEFLYYENNEVADHRKYERDKKGNLLKEHIYFNDDTFDTIHYKYDEYMNLVEKTTVNSDGGTDEKEINEYNEERIVKSEEGEPRREKLLTIHTVFDGDNKKTTEFTYKYNEGKVGKVAGKVAELTEWDSDSDKKFKTVNTYNENGILIKQLRYLKDNLIAKLVFEVNENNKVYEVLDEDTRHRNTLKISYDDKGNIVEEAEFDRNNELNHSIKRTYNENNDVTESVVFIDHRLEGYQENYRIRYSYE